MMRKLVKWVGRLLVVLLLLILLLWALGPREPVETDMSFDPGVFGDDLDAYFSTREAAVGGITPGVEKEIVWSGAPGEKSALSILYVHGFSATSGEIRPVADRVAAELGANLVYTRLTGHGRDGAALAEATVGDWMQDLAEGLAAARLVGEEVLLVGTSTGGTLITLALDEPGALENVSGMVLISPNFGINNPAAALLTMPAARYWVPLVAGRDRSFETRNEAHARLWTSAYPTVAVLPMAASVEAAMKVDVSRTDIPALFYFSDSDGVVRPDLTRDVASRWGGPVSIVNPVMGEGDDPYSHVIAGDAQSPSQNDAAVAAIVEFARGL